MRPVIPACRGVLNRARQGALKRSRGHSTVSVPVHWASSSPGATFHSPSPTPSKHHDVAGPQLTDVGDQLHTLCRDRALVDAVALIEQRLKAGLHVPVEAAGKVMRSCTTRLAVDLVARLITMQGVKWDSSRIGEAIMEFGERAGAEDALQLLRAAQGAGVPLKAGVYTVAMNACARAHRFDKVESLLNDVRRARLPFNRRDYACVLSAFYKLERWRESLDLLRDMKLAGVEPDKQCYLTAIATCLRVGEWQASTDLVRSLSTYASKEDWARPQLDQEKVAHHVIQLKSAMDAAGLKPTQYIADYVLGELANTGQVKSCVLMLEEMRHAGLRTDTHHFATPLQACRTSETVNVDVALALLKTMQKQKLTAMHPTLYTETMRVCMKGGRYDEVLNLEEDMKQHGIPVRGQVELLVLKALVKLKREPEARRRLESPTCPLPFPHIYSTVIAPQQLRPTPEQVDAALAMLHECLVSAKDPERRQDALTLCLALVDSMEWHPGLLAPLRHMLVGHLEGSPKQLADMLEPAMAVLWTKPRHRAPLLPKTNKMAIKFCCLVLEAYARAGRWRPALRMLERMRKRGPRPTGGAVANAILACGAAQRVDEALQLMRRVDPSQFAEGGEVVTASLLYNVTIQACRSKPLVALYLLEELRCQNRGRANATSTVMEALSQDKVLFDLFAAGVMSPFFDLGGFKGFAVSLDEETMKVDLHRVDPCVAKAAVLHVLYNWPITKNVRLYVATRLEAKKAIFEVLEGQPHAISFAEHGGNNQYVFMSKGALEAFRAASKGTDCGN